MKFGRAPHTATIFLIGTAPETFPSSQSHFVTEQPGHPVWLESELGLEPPHRLARAEERSIRVVFHAWMVLQKVVSNRYHQHGHDSIRLELRVTEDLLDEADFPRNETPAIR